MWELQDFKENKVLKGKNWLSVGRRKAVENESPTRAGTVAESDVGVG